MVYFHKTDQLKVKSKMNEKLIKKNDPLVSFQNRKINLVEKVEQTHQFYYPVEW